eukprot:Pompholyxophrys_punicea_v1_NODE_172_length_3030_cov_9.793592.p2 type:complete len:206 gc:universal NODE_172_length_3030_cov_9.793592:1128-1745(+)
MCSMAISVILRIAQIICPTDPDGLLRAVFASNSFAEQFGIDINEGTNETTLNHVLEVYKSSSDNEVKMICLSQVCHLPLKELQSLIKVTPRMYTEARKISLELMHDVKDDEKKHGVVHRYKDQTVLNCISFLLSPENIQHVAHGCKTVKLSTGEKVTLPRLQRKVIRSRLWERYRLSFPLENNRVGNTVFYRICNKSWVGRTPKI